MIQRRTMEFSVGVFILMGIIALVTLALKVSGLTTLGSLDGYQIKAQFNNIGDLRIRAPVRIAGVTVGQVTDIQLDKKTFRGTVLLTIDQNVKLPGGTSASIYTQGLLGSNYISLTPGFDDDEPLKNGAQIIDTHSALILENLIGQFMFSVSNKAK